MHENYLDSEKKFYNYGTASVSGTNIFDETKTGTPFYDQFLRTSELDYLRDRKNLVGSITYMSPEEYYKECADHAFGRKVSVQELKNQRAADKSTLEHLKQVLTIYKKRFPLPYINYAEKGQEGLHRMYVAGELLGWTHPKHPVLVIHWADEDRHQREKKQARDYEIQCAIERAVKHTSKYRFIDVDDVEQQLEFDLNRAFEFIDEIKKPVDFNLTENGNNFIVKVSDVEYEFSKDDIEFKETDDVEETELDDLDIDLELDSFLAKYLK